MNFLTALFCNSIDSRLEEFTEEGEWKISRKVVDGASVIKA